MNQDLVYFGWFTELECDIKSEPRSDRGERFIPFRVCHWSIVANQGLSLVENDSLRLSEHPSSPVLALPAQLLSWLDNGYSNFRILNVDVNSTICATQKRFSAVIQCLLAVAELFKLSTPQETIHLHFSSAWYPFYISGCLVLRFKNDFDLCVTSVIHDWVQKKD